MSVTALSVPLLQASFNFGAVALIVVPVLLVLFFVTMLVRQYRRCPSNRILVIYGKVTGQRAAKCMHGGGAFIVPLLQSYAYLNLEPQTIEIELTSALSKKNIRVNVPSTFTIGISTHPDIMNNAAERLLALSEKEIATQARDIILGQMRLVIATLSIEEINQDREKFLDLVNKNVSTEVNKIGLELINVNIRDIMDESGYIEALGRKAASEAINQAKVEVAEADRGGAIGESSANREMQVQVAEQRAQSAMGQKQAERDQRITVAKLEAEGISGEANSNREKEVAVAEQQAIAVQGKKQAETEQRVRVSLLESDAVKGENDARANIADYQATLEERQAEARRRGEVSLANASRDVLAAQKEEELARLEKTQIAQQMIERQKVEIDADAEAERVRRIARGQADAVLAKYNAEAEGLQKVLEAKAAGYENLIRVCGDRKDLAPALLIIEKLPELVAEQVKAIQNLKIDKVTVWDSGANGVGEGGSTSNFLRGLIGSLPPIHELAEQAGIDLPEVLGKVRREAPPEDAAAAGKGDAAPHGELSSMESGDRELRVERLRELVGHERSLAEVSQRLYFCARELDAEGVGALHVTCADETEHECAEAFQRGFAHYLLPSLKFAQQSAMRLANLGGRYEWGALRIAEQHFATPETRRGFKLVVVKVNAHVALEEGAAVGSPGAGMAYFGHWRRYDAPSFCCGALDLLMKGGAGPFLDDLRETMTSEGRDRLSILTDEQQVAPANRALFAALVSARLQARKSVLEAQDHEPTTPTLYLVVPAVTVNRPERDTEIPCGFYIVDARVEHRPVVYYGLGDDPARYRLERQHGMVIVTDEQLGGERKGRDHRALAREALHGRTAGRLLETRDPRLDRIHEDVSQNKHRHHHHARALLRAALPVLAEVAPVPAAILMFADGAVGIHHAFRIQRLARELEGNEEARQILEEVHARVDELDPDRAEALIEMLMREYRP